MYVDAWQFQAIERGNVGIGDAIEPSDEEAKELVPTVFQGIRVPLEDPGGPVSGWTAGWVIPNTLAIRLVEPNVEAELSIDLVQAGRQGHSCGPPKFLVAGEQWTTRRYGADRC